MDRIKVLKAIADETRMKILGLLLEHRCCVRALANQLGLTQATISQHLKVMREAGLLAGERHGYFMHYGVQRPVLHELAKEIESLANIQQKTLQPEKQDGCPAAARQNCHKKGACGSEAKSLCHSENGSEKEEG